MRNSTLSRLSLLGALLLAAGCTSTATVVSSSSGPSIAQVQQAPANGPQYRVAISAFDYKAAQRSDVGQGMADMLAPIDGQVCRPHHF